MIRTVPGFVLTGVTRKLRCWASSAKSSRSVIAIDFILTLRLIQLADAHGIRFTVPLDTAEERAYMDLCGGWIDPWNRPRSLSKA